MGGAHGPAYLLPTARMQTCRRLVHGGGTHSGLHIAAWRQTPRRLPACPAPLAAAQAGLEAARAGAELRCDFAYAGPLRNEDLNCFMEYFDWVGCHCFFGPF